MEQTIQEQQKWTTVIKPREKLLSVDLGEIWKYRDLCSLFVKRNIVVQYKQTVLGPLWYVIQPAITVIMYMVVFGGIAGIPTDGIPQPLFYLSGTCLWNYFSQCIGKTSTTFQENSGLFGKVYFPRLISPISEVVSHVFRFFIQLSLFVIVYLIFVIKGADVHPNWYLLLFPVLVVMLGGIAL